MTALLNPDETSDRLLSSSSSFLASTYNLYTYPPFPFTVDFPVIDRIRISIGGEKKPDPIEREREKRGFSVSL